MVEQPPRHDAIEKDLKTKNLIAQIRVQIHEGNFGQGPGWDEMQGGPGEAPVLDLPVGVRIFYCNDYVANHDLQDALERPLENLRMEGRRGLLLLVDPDPSANWAHPCWIASIDLEHSEVLRVVRNNYPPLETPERRLVRYAASYPAESKRRLA